MLVAIYARESSDDKIKAPPIADQIDRIKQFTFNPPEEFWASFKQLEVKHLEVNGIYSDEMSGKRTDRPGYLQMMEAAKNGQFRILLIWYHDRIMRNSAAYHLFIADMKKYGVKIYSTSERRYIKDEDIKDFVINTMDGFTAELYSRQTGEKIKEAYRLKKTIAEERGERVKWAGAWPIEYVKKTKDLKQLGFSIREIAEKLKDKEGNGPKKSWVANILNGAG